MRWKTVFFETFRDEIVAMVIRVFLGILSTSLCFAIYFSRSSDEYDNLMYLYLTGR